MGAADHHLQNRHAILPQAHACTHAHQHALVGINGALGSEEGNMERRAKAADPSAQGISMVLITVVVANTGALKHNSHGSIWHYMPGEVPNKTLSLFLKQPQSSLPPS